MSITSSYPRIKAGSLSAGWKLLDADPQAAVDERAESTVCIAGARRKTAGTAAEYRFDAMRRWKFDLPGRTGRSSSNARAAFGRRGDIRERWALKPIVTSTTPRQCRVGGCCALPAT